MGALAFIAPRRLALYRSATALVSMRLLSTKADANMIETDDHFEIKFRVGACQDAHWIRNEAKRSAKKGKNAQEIWDTAAANCSRSCWIGEMIVQACEAN